MTVSELPSPGSEAVESPWQGLHPLSVVVNLIPQAWRTLRGSWPILLAVVVGAGAGMQFFDLSLLLLFFALAFGRTFVHFATLRYRVHAGRFEVRFGLLNRQARELDPARIQNISLERNLFHRAAGLVEVRVETAGDAGIHGLLSALSVEAAQQLQQQLKALVDHSRAGEIEGAPTDPGLPQPRADAASTPEAGPTLVGNNPAELIGYGLSKRTLGTVAVLSAVGFELLTRMGPEGAEQIAWMQSRPLVLVAAVLLAFAGSWLWSAANALFRHWGYRLVRVGDRLVSTEGLTTTRRVEIPLRKVQVVQIHEPLLRRRMGYGTVLIETAALGFADGQLRQAEGVLPMVDQDELGAILAEILPRAAADPNTWVLRPPAPRALYRAIVGRALRYAFLATLLTAMLSPSPWGALAYGLVLLALPAGYLDWRWQGWLVTPHAVVARRGFFNRRTWVIARDKIQSLHLSQGPMLQWHGLAQLDLRVAGSEIELPALRLEDAEALYAELCPAGRPLDLPSFRPLPG